MFIRFTRKGILLEQNKEPALSRPLRTLYEDMPRTKLDMRLPANPLFLAPHEILAFSKAAKIIDESDGRSLWRKIESALKDGVSDIIVDAVDDEPYISSRLAPVIHLPEELSIGVELIKRAAGARAAQIDVYDNRVDVQKPIPHKIEKIPVRRVYSHYPVGYRNTEKNHARSILSVGAGALIHLKRAVCEGYQQETAFITVAGNCTSNPGNYEVPVGTSVSEVIKITGIIEEPKRIVIGGSMTGYCITNPDLTKVSVGTRGILTFDRNFREDSGSCIGCGRCTESCPEGLSPYHIYHMLTAAGRKELDVYDINRCVGCGTCSYICPAKINLAHIITMSKSRYSAEKR